MTIRRRPTAVLLTLVVVLVGGCAASDRSSGPLDAGSGVALSCLAERGAKEFTAGSNVIGYDGRTPLEIIEVGLEPDEGLEIGEALLLPVEGTLVGSLTGWPPPEYDALRSRAVPAAGARMGSGAVTSYNLVAHLSRDDPSQPIAPTALRIRYRVGVVEYSVLAGIRIAVGGDRPCE